MTAVRSKQPSAPSPQVCTTTPAAVASTASPSATAPPSGGAATTPPASRVVGGTPTRPAGVPDSQPVFPASDWVAVVSLFPVEDSTSSQVAAAVGALKPTPPAAAYALQSVYYPGLGFTRPTAVVAVGPFATKTAAAAFCATVPSGCQPGNETGQPGPPTTPPNPPSSAAPSPASS